MFPLNIIAVFCHMICINSEEISKNSLIDLVVVPDIVVEDMLDEILIDENRIIFLDTKGNISEISNNIESSLHNFSSGDEIDNTLDKSCIDNSSYTSTFPSLQFTQKFQANNFLHTIDDSSQKTDNDSHFPENSEANLEEGSQFPTDKHIRTFLISSIDKLISTLYLIKKYKNFILVIDSITLVEEENISYIKDIINLLWSIILENSSTVICINHYKVGRIKHSYHLIPKMGKIWEQYLTYRVFCNIKRNKLDYKIKEYRLYG